MPLLRTLVFDLAFYVPACVFILSSQSFLAWRDSELVMSKSKLARVAATCGVNTRGGASGTFINAQDSGKQLTAAFAAAAAQMDRGYGIELESLTD